MSAFSELCGGGRCGASDVRRTTHAAVSGGGLFANPSFGADGVYAVATTPRSVQVM